MNFFFQAEDGIRSLVRSRGLGDVYNEQPGTLDVLLELEWVKPIGRKKTPGSPIIASYTHLTLPTNREV